MALASAKGDLSIMGRLDAAKPLRAGRSAPTGAPSGAEMWVLAGACRCLAGDWCGRFGPEVESITVQVCFIWCWEMWLLTSQCSTTGPSGLQIGVRNLGIPSFLIFLLLLGYLGPGCLCCCTDWGVPLTLLLSAQDFSCN